MEKVRYQFVYLFKLVFPCQGFFSSDELHTFNVVNYLVLFISPLFYLVCTSFLLKFVSLELVLKYRVSPMPIASMIEGGDMKSHGHIVVCSFVCLQI